MTIFYVHGLGSGTNSSTGKYIANKYKDDKVVCLEMPLDPLEAKEYLLNMYSKHKPDLIIGTSLGGFYAMQVGGCYKLLINPAIMADKHIKEKIGLGVYDYYCERLNGALTYEVNNSLIDKLKKLRTEFFSYAYDLEYINETYAYFGTNDELFSDLELFKNLYREKQSFVGNCGHRLTNDIIDIDIDKIISLIRKRVNKVESN